MKLQDQWQFIRSNMKKSKSRVYMTVLASAMACTFLVVLASVGFGIHDTLIKDVIENRNVTQIEIYGLDKDGESKEIGDEEIKQIENMEGVKAVTRSKELAQTPVYRTDNYAGHGWTVVSHFPSEIEAGMEVEEGRLPENANEIIVGHHFSNELIPQDKDVNEIFDANGELLEEFAYKDSLLGKEISLTVSKETNGKEEEHTLNVTIVGITAPPARGWMEDRTVHISEELLAEIEDFTGTVKGAVHESEDHYVSSGYDRIHAYAHNMEGVVDISEQLNEEGYYAYSPAEELKNINVVFTIVKAGLIFIGTIAIIIASIGIYNTMTMAVTERTPDIGIMKALGAHPKKIKQIFLLESSYIGLLGVLIGIVASYIISFIANIGLTMIVEGMFEEQLPEGFRFSSIPLSLVAITVIICLTVTVISGSKPAKKATQVDVLQALRREI
ncbi:acetoin utilization transport system permease protein [Gracilibacillus halotolerans]|uniref:Acetoin utilization transport system permease protein n=1 Tax=Gracilibacillus halotolerans TaxID=74386 RepID=A0A841RR87_9BACI|nr:ABC transporter permease [Gracilibacillus halotolerans]MBB6513118.1 acetoin utilization transport system permease protein [Gracilibacillus halotolerans]